MHLELVELLRCPIPHAASVLVAAADRITARFVVQGVLGCPVCGGEYPIRDGVTDLRVSATPGLRGIETATVAASVPESAPGGATTGALTTATPTPTPTPTPTATPTPTPPATQTPTASATAVTPVAGGANDGLPDGSDSTGSASAEAGLRVAAQLAMSEGRAVFALVGVAAPIVLRIRELVSARLLLVNCMGVEALHDVGMDGVGAAHAVGTLGSGTLGSGTLGSGTLAGATLGSGTRAGATLGSATLAAGTFGSTPIGIVQTDDLLPLALAKFDGVAFSYAAKPQVLDQAVTVLKAGGRLVAPAECRLPAGTTELARDDREWIATRDNVPSVPIGITRR